MCKELDKILYHEFLPKVVDNDAFEKYLQIVTRRINNPPIDCAVEKHHIVPKCFLPKSEYNVIENIVTLTPEEHLIAHKYLYFATRNNKLLYAIWQMTNTYACKVSPELLDSSQFREIRECARRMSSEHQKGRRFTEEHRKHLSDSHKGHTLSDSQKQAISKSNKGKIKDDEWRKHLSESHKGEINRKYGTIYLHKDDKEIRVWEDEVDAYLSEGWNRGRKQIKYRAPSIKAYRWIHKDGVNTRVNELSLQEFLEDGWVLGKYVKSQEEKQRDKLLKEQKILAARFSEKKPYHKDFDELITG